MPGPLTGVIDYNGIIQETPNGDFLLIGEDANRYVVIGGGGYYANVGHCESNLVQFAINETQFLIDLASPEAGITGLVGTYQIKHHIPITGTPNFVILGAGRFGQGNTTHVVGVIYKIVNPTTVQIVGGFKFEGAGANHLANGGAIGTVHGAITIGTDLWIVLTCGFIQVALCRLPTSGSTSEGPGSWTSRVNALPWNWRFWTAASRRYYNKGTLIDAGGGKIGVLAYASATEVPSNMSVYSGISPVPTTAFMAYTEVTPGVGHSGVTDVSSQFGIPLADETKNHAGTSGSLRDCYTSPSNIYGESQLALGRVYSDEREKALFRFYDYTTDPFTVTAGLVVEGTFDLPGGLVFGVNERAMVYKEADEYHMCIMDFENVLLGLLDVPVTPPEAPPQETPDLTPEVPIETEEELPPAEAAIETQRWLVRTGHIRQWGLCNIDDMRLTIKRGVGDTAFEPKIWIRAQRDNRHWTKWVKKGLGKKGDRIMQITTGGWGSARDWQFEFATTDECEIELRKVETLRTPLGH